MSALLRQRVFRVKIDTKLRVFWGCDFGCILGGFWEAKIINFHTFFDVFSKSILKRGSEGEQIDQKCEKSKLFRFLATGLRWSPPRWGNLKEGVRTLQIEFSEEMFEISLQKAFRDDDCDLARRCHTYGGRRIEPPRGGPPPPTHF